MNAIPPDDESRRTADPIDRDTSLAPNLMWVFAACLLFLIGAGIYVSATRDHEGMARTEPVTTDSSVAGARSSSYQSTGQSSGGETTGQR